MVLIHPCFCATITTIHIWDYFHPAKLKLYTHLTLIHYLLPHSLTNSILLFIFINLTNLDMSSVQFSSVAQSCPTICDPMNRSTPGLPVHHQLLESTQTHAHRVSDAIQPSHPLLSPSPPAPNPSQHQGLFQ